MEGRIKTIEERFWEKVRKGDGCWEWIGAMLKSGYGQFMLNGRRSSPKNVRAHRLAWEMKNGPVQDGLLVCHHCDNRKCVRPDHMFLGTHLDNAHDAIRKGRRKSNA